MGCVNKKPIFFCFFNSFANLDEKEIKKISQKISSWNRGQIISFFNSNESDLFTLSIKTKTSLLSVPELILDVRHCYSIRGEIEDLLERYSILNNFEKKQHKKQIQEIVPIFLLLSQEDVDRFTREKPIMPLLSVYIGKEDFSNFLPSWVFPSIEKFGLNIPFF